MGRLTCFDITESDMKTTLRFTDNTLKETLHPLVDMLRRDYEGSYRSPFILALAGPPGSGKSAIAAVMRILLGERGITVAVLPMDGFHKRNDELRSSTIRLAGGEVSPLSLKGAKETYDTESFALCLKRLRNGERFFWPLYSRVLHEPVNRGIHVGDTGALCIIEGNYLLLNEEPWKNLVSLFDRKVLIVTRERFLRGRIIRRKMRGGYTRKEATAHYFRSDRRNIREVMENSDDADYLLVQTGKYRYTLMQRPP